MNGLTITMIFKAQSLNYGEGIGNISELKKLSRGDGNVYTFASRQALRYDIARLGHQMFNWNLEVVDKSKGTVQFSDKYSIKDSEEMDLFGYMKTSKKSEDTDGGSDIRSAAVRISKVLNREIKGRQENLSPLFAIGGVYPINTPFYLGRVELEGKDGQFRVKLDTLKQTGELKVGGNSIEGNTMVGLVDGVFSNKEEINQVYEGKTYHIQEFFENLENKVHEYYQ